MLSSYGSIYFNNNLPISCRHKKTYNKRDDKKKSEYNQYLERARLHPGALLIKLYRIESNLYNI